MFKHTKRFRVPSRFCHPAEIGQRITCCAIRGVFPHNPFAKIPNPNVLCFQPSSG
jgi:hypothetical protein